MTHTDRDTLIDTTTELVNRPSVNPGGTEAAVVDYLLKRLDASFAPFDVETTEVFPDRSNVVARAGDDERGSILLTGHMDVVPADESRWSGDPFSLRHEGNKLVGRGVTDMKGALAAQLVAAETYLDSADAPGEVVLAFVVDEENGGTGTERFVETPPNVDCAVIGEPTSLNVCTAQYGCARYHIHATGQSGHAGRPEQGRNPIYAVPRIITALRRLDEMMDEYEHGLLSPGSVTPTKLRSSIAHNVVPDDASITIDWRFPPGVSDSPSWFDTRLTEALPDDAYSTEAERYNYYPAIETDRDADIVDVLLRAASEAGRRAEVAGFHAGSDARYLVPVADIPTVLFGPGSIEADAHTVDESVSVETLHTAAETYYVALNTFLD